MHTQECTAANDRSATEVCICPRRRKPEDSQQTTHAPKRKRPTGPQINAALRTLAAALAWEEWTAEPGRVFDDAEAIDSYRESLLDLAHDREQGEAEIADLALSMLGLTAGEPE